MQQLATQATTVAAVGTGVGTVVGFLPAAAALFTIVWLGLQIWESKTSQSIREWLKRKKQERRAKKSLKHPHRTSDDDWDHYH